MRIVLNKEKLKEVKKDLLEKQKKEADKLLKNISKELLELINKNQSIKETFNKILSHNEAKGIKDKIDKLSSIAAFPDTTKKEANEATTNQTNLASNPQTEAENEKYPCPKCKTGFLERRYSKNTGNHFWGCSNYLTEIKCNATYPDNNGKIAGIQK